MRFIKLYHSKKEDWTLAIKLLLIMNMTIVIFLGFVYGIYRSVSIINSAGATFSGNNMNLFLLYLAPAIFLLFGTIKLAMMDPSSKEIYTGVFVLYFFVSQLIYLIDFAYYNASIAFYISFILIIPNVYVLLIDNSSRIKFNKLEINNHELSHIQ